MPQAIHGLLHWFAIGLEATVPSILHILAQALIINSEVVSLKRGLPSYEDGNPILTQYKPGMLQNSLHAFSALVLASCLYACQPQGKEDSLAAVVSVDSVSVPLDDSAPLLASIRTYIPSEKGAALLAGYHIPAKQLRFFDVESWKSASIPPISLAQLEGGGIQGLQGIAIHTLDSIFLMSTTAIYLINRQAEVLRKWRINDATQTSLKGIDFNRSLLVSQAETPLYFHSPSASLCIRHKPLVSKFDPAYYQAPLAVMLDIRRDSVSFLPVLYPKVLQEQPFGMLGEPKWALKHNTLFWGIEALPEVFAFDLQSRKALPSPKSIRLQAFRPAQSFSGSQGDDLALIRHIEENPGYLTLYTGAQTPFLYRPYFSGKTATVAGRGQLRLLILDQNLQPVADGAIPNALNPASGLWNSKGFWLQDMAHPEEEKVLFRLWGSGR